MSDWSINDILSDWSITHQKPIKGTIALRKLILASINLENWVETRPDISWPKLRILYNVLHELNPVSLLMILKISTKLTLDCSQLIVIFSYTNKSFRSNQLLLKNLFKHYEPEHYSYGFLNFWRFWVELL